MGDKIYFVSTQTITELIERIDVLENKVSFLELNSGGTSTTVSTDEEMAALLSEDNEGRIVKFTGAESETYDENEYYLIDEDN